MEYGTLRSVAAPYPMQPRRFAEAHGTHEDTRRHVLTPETAAMLASARRSRGWSLRQAARQTGVSFGTIGNLETARRAPSTAVALILVSAYRLSHDDSRQLLGESVTDAGRSSPRRASNGKRPIRRSAWKTGGPRSPNTVEYQTRGAQPRPMEDALR
jgi:transcriptional regulator with XRE-family HTH domain